MRAKITVPDIRAAKGKRRLTMVTAYDCTFAQLIDRGTMFLEIGLLVAWDQYNGQAPAAGVVTGIGRIENRPAVIVANDATVKAAPRQHAFGDDLRFDPCTGSAL